MRIIVRLRPRTRGQALVEFALVFPIFLLLLFAIISFGLYVFYNQQLSNAAREAARYAAVHSSTAQCPTVSQLDPRSDMLPASGSYWRCDPPERGWPEMTAEARANIWGMAPNQVSLSACWSGYIDRLTLQRDQSASTPDPVEWRDCTIGGVNPQTDPSTLTCPAPVTSPPSDPNRETATANGDDKASNVAVVAGSTGSATHYPTTVTVYTCFNWRPPLAGVRLKVPWGTWSIGMPDTIKLQAVVTEALQRQQ
jgi:Flp pilus assembly protein TadG